MFKIENGDVQLPKVLRKSVKYQYHYYVKTMMVKLLGESVGGRLHITCFTGKLGTRVSWATPPTLYAFIPINQPQLDYIDSKSIKLHFLTSRTSLCVMLK